MAVGTRPLDLSLLLFYTSIHHRPIHRFLLVALPTRDHRTQMCSLHNQP
jgi:hypothetical protein